MLVKKSTSEIHKVEDSRGVPKLKSDAVRGGHIASNARHELEHELKRSIVSKKNFIPLVSKRG